MPESGSTLSLVGDGEVTSAGVIHLSPVQHSLDRRSISVEIPVAASDGRLRFGDLRSAALALDAKDEFEAAHRLWIIVGTAAFKQGDLVMATKADERAERSLGLARGRDVKSAGRSAQYDYDALVNDRAAGLSIADTAKRWSCSPTTVKRASQYVEVRDTMLVEKPGLIEDIEKGVDVSELALTYNVEAKIMRWIVVSHFDRRLAERDE